MPWDGAFNVDDPCVEQIHLRLLDRRPHSAVSHSLNCGKKSCPKSCFRVNLFCVLGCTRPLVTIEKLRNCESIQIDFVLTTSDSLRLPPIWNRSDVLLFVIFLRPAADYAI